MPAENAKESRYVDAASASNRRGRDVERALKEHEKDVARMRVKDKNQLDTPVVGRKRKMIDFDGDRVGEAAEGIARFLGTGKYLAYQTIVVVVWVGLNIGGFWWNWDPYPFILLNLAFSTQAAYAAPLILLAQNRQEDRDRAAVAEDRRRAEETKADTEFLAREIAGVRAVVGDTVTRDYLRHELEDLSDALVRIEERLYELNRKHSDEGELDRTAKAYADGTENTQTS